MLQNAQSDRKEGNKQ